MAKSLSETEVRATFSTVYLKLSFGNHLLKDAISDFEDNGRKMSHFVLI